jgi:hypothetical protein
MATKLDDITDILTDGLHTLGTIKKRLTEVAGGQAKAKLDELIENTKEEAARKLLALAAKLSK